MRDVLWGLAATAVGLLWFGALVVLTMRLPVLDAYALLVVPLLLFVGLALLVQERRRRRVRKRLLEQELRR